MSRCQCGKHEATTILPNGDGSQECHTPHLCTQRMRLDHPARPTRRLLGPFTNQAADWFALGFIFGCSWFWLVWFLLKELKK